MEELRKQMRGYKEDQKKQTPVPVQMPVDQPMNVNVIVGDIVHDERSIPFIPETVGVSAEPEPAPLTFKLSSGLLARFTSAPPIEASRYRSRPWKQLPNESPLEYALFHQYLILPLAKGRDLDDLSKLLNDPQLSGWFEQLVKIPSLQVPKYITERRFVKKTEAKGKKKSITEPETNDTDSPDPAEDRHETESRALWWLSDHNYWPERGRLYDAWQMEIHVAARKQQIQLLARDMHAQYLDHLSTLTAIHREVSQGVLAAAVKAQGQMKRIKEVQNIPGVGEIVDTRTGKIIREATPFITREVEYDPFQLIDTMFRLKDQIYGPLPNMLDGDVTTILDQSLSLPPVVDHGGNELEAGVGSHVPVKRQTDAPWLMERLTKIHDAVEKRKLIVAPVHEIGPGENEKPSGT